MAIIKWTKMRSADQTEVKQSLGAIFHASDICERFEQWEEWDVHHLAMKELDRLVDGVLATPGDP